MANKAIEEDLSGPAQALRENYRGHVHRVVQVSQDEIEVHLPKSSPLTLPKNYRGFKVTRIEVAEEIPKRFDRADAGEPTRQDLDALSRNINAVNDRVDQHGDRVEQLAKELAEVRGRLAGLETLVDAPPSKTTKDTPSKTTK